MHVKHLSRKYGVDALDRKVPHHNPSKIHIRFQSKSRFYHKSSPKHYPRHPWTFNIFRKEIRRQHTCKQLREASGKIKHASEEEQRDADAKEMLRSRVARWQADVHTAKWVHDEQACNELLRVKKLSVMPLGRLRSGVTRTLIWSTDAPSALARGLKRASIVVSPLPCWETRWGGRKEGAKAKTLA